MGGFKSVALKSPVEFIRAAELIKQGSEALGACAFEFQHPSLQALWIRVPAEQDLIQGDNVFVFELFRDFVVDHVVVFIFSTLAMARKPRPDLPTTLL